MRGWRTNKWHTQWQRCFYNNRCALTHQWANGCCPHGSNSLCVTHFPKVNCLGKISMLRQKNQRRNFNPFKFRHRVSNTLRKEQMWQESWADPRKLPEWNGRDFRLDSSIEVQFWPLSPSALSPLPLRLPPSRRERGQNWTNSIDTIFKIKVLGKITLRASLEYSFYWDLFFFLKWKHNFRQKNRLPHENLRSRPQGSPIF